MYPKWQNMPPHLGQIHHSLDLKESDKDSSWDADIEDVGVYARAPIRRPMLPPKVKMFKPRRRPVRWLHGISTMVPPTTDQEPRSYYYPSSLQVNLKKSKILSQNKTINHNKIKCLS